MSEIEIQILEWQLLVLVKQCNFIVLLENELSFTHLIECSSIEEPSDGVVLLYGLDTYDFSVLPKLFKFVRLLLLLFLWPTLLPLPSITLPFEGTGCGDIFPAKLFNVCNMLTEITSTRIHEIFSHRPFLEAEKSPDS